MNLADNSKEAKSIIMAGKVLVDGRIVKNYKFPVGFMDVITVPSANIYMRVLIDNNGILRLKELNLRNPPGSLSK